LIKKDSRNKLKNFKSKPFNPRWFVSERFKYVNRTFGAKEVAEIKPTLSLVTPSHYMAKKLYWLLRENFKNRTCSNTFGALDNIQVVTMCKYFTSIYVSGW